MRVGVAMFLAGLVGIVAAVVTLLPAQLRLVGKAPPVPMPLLSAAAIAQSAVLLALLVWAGVALAPRVGLEAPVFRALVGRGALASAFEGRWVAGVVGGVFGGGLLILFDRFLPAALARTEAKLTLPLPVRVLYGGVTEELLTRWGLMSLLVWLGCRFVQRGEGLPSLPVVGAAVVVSAVVFAVGHLPTVAVLVGELTRPVVGYVVVANAVFGVVAGVLFWRYGLEAAMLAHGLAHVFAWVGERVGLVAV